MKLIAFILTLLTIGLSIGCRSLAPAPARHRAVADNAEMTVGHYGADSVRLRPGLIVNVSVLVGGKSEIEAKNKRINDNGTLAMPLLGNLVITNQTLDELSVMLEKRYREYLVNPQILVEFVRDDGKEGFSPWGNVTVLGRVKRPGRISLPATRDLTVSGAIQQAGGFDTSAKESAIRITRRLPNGQMKVVEVDLHSVGAKGLVEKDLLLEPDDVVFVPEMMF